MEKERFIELLRENLIPMFSGARVGKGCKATTRQQRVALHGPCKLLIRPKSDSAYRLELVRSQKFITQEKQLVELFMEEFESILSVNEDLLEDVMPSLLRRVIAKLLFPQASNTIQKGILQFEELASQTYEGRPVVSALGITGSQGHGEVRMEDLWKEDFSRVVSNGFDSMFQCGRDGRIFNVSYLRSDVQSPLLAPFRLSAVSQWANKSRIALVLNRNSEILIFKDRMIQFAKRRGKWRYYPHDSIIMCLGPGNTKLLRQAIYESCLDISFGRSGGCLAWIDENNGQKLSKLIDPDDLIENHSKTRTKLLRNIVKKKFHLLDRRLRQELLAMDGATILDHKGNVLSAGAIVKVPGGSIGGGRRAAAVQLSKLGLAVKISADGPITGFKNKQEIFNV